MLINVTGLIASGKSTLVNVWKRNGAHVISSDQISREVVAPGSAALARIHDRWGDEALGADGDLNREFMAQKVFSSPEMRDAMNAILHPLIEQRTREKIGSYGSHDVVVLDVPLIHNSGLQYESCANVVVDSPEDVRIDRMVANRGMTYEQARARIASQISQTELNAYADVLIHNTTSHSNFEQIAHWLWNEWVVDYAKNLHAGLQNVVPTEVSSAPDVEYVTQIPLIQMRLRAAGIHADAVTGTRGLIGNRVDDAALAQIGWAPLGESGLSWGACSLNPAQHIYVEWCD